ncbi:hypothetical protein HDU84_004415 [Entophlyctis sp. JEL0112]|nr:hypothetical protein HDU84_004415 [Entophlyctis sp. JEL0112]
MSAPFENGARNSAMGPKTSGTGSMQAGSSPFFDSLFANDSAHFQQKRNWRSNNAAFASAPQQQRTLVNATVDAYEDVFKATIDCPKCLGKGWNHDSTTKHDKNAKLRCKACTTCKVVKAKSEKIKFPARTAIFKGLYILRPMKDPMMRLRTCGAFTAKFANPAMVEVPVTLPPMLPQLSPVVPAQMSPPMSSQQISASPANIPAPPVLNVVMVKSADDPGKQIPMVELAGIGLVPAEQIIKMTVPMVIMPQISAPAPNAVYQEDTHEVTANPEETEEALNAIWS